MLSRMGTHMAMAVKSNKNNIWRHIRPDKAIRGHIRPYKANTPQCTTEDNILPQLHLGLCELNFDLSEHFLFPHEYFLFPHNHFLFPHKHFLFPQTFLFAHEHFLFSRTFFELDSTPTRTTELLLGTLSVACGQKEIWLSGKNYGWVEIKLVTKLVYLKLVTLALYGN